MKDTSGVQRRRAFSFDEDFAPFIKVQGLFPNRIILAGSKRLMFKMRHPPSFEINVGSPRQKIVGSRTTNDTVDSVYEMDLCESH